MFAKGSPKTCTKKIKIKTENYAFLLMSFFARFIIFLQIGQRQNVYHQRKHQSERNSTALSLYVKAIYLMLSGQ
jgi:hypothetical protein